MTKATNSIPQEQTWNKREINGQIFTKTSRHYVIYNHLQIYLTAITSHIFE